VGYHPGMKLSRAELARRFAEADKMVVLLRRATLDMQSVREFLLKERRREPERPGSDRAARG
jgi:hypothetical protein